MKTCLLFKSLPDNAVQCTACNHYCTIQNNQTGICGIRQNRNGKLKLLTYGKAISESIDPIEKKPLYHFLPGSNILSIATVGCNFHCDFCQNRTISQAKAMPEILKQGKKLSPKEVVQHCSENNIPSIAYTYTEPTVFFEYCFDTMKLAHKAGIRNVRVSNGFMSLQALEKMKKYLDAVNIDLKAFTDEFYRDTCGARLQPILDTIKRLRYNKIRQEITTLIIPGKNDSEEELTKIAQFLYSVSPDIPWHLSAFSPTYKMDDIPPTPLETLTKAYKIGKKVGLKYIYIGNVRNNEHEHTNCPNCNTEIISRIGFSITIHPEFTDGLCPKCKTPIAGVRK